VASRPPLFFLTVRSELGSRTTGPPEIVHLSAENLPGNRSPLAYAQTQSLAPQRLRD
jgi:hypothetical protein